MRAVAKAHRRTGVPDHRAHPPGHARPGWRCSRCSARRGSTRAASCSATAATPPTSTTCSELADAGFVLGMDRFGINLDTTFEARADIVVEMCRRGYAEQHGARPTDASCYIDWIDPAVHGGAAAVALPHIHEDVLPYLREHGVTDEQIDTMLVANPRRLLRAGRKLLTATTPAARRAAHSLGGGCRSGLTDLA